MPGRTRGSGIDGRDRSGRICDGRDHGWLNVFENGPKYLGGQFVDWCTLITESASGQQGEGQSLVEETELTKDDGKGFECSG